MKTEVEIKALPCLPLSMMYVSHYAFTLIGQLYLPRRFLCPFEDDFPQRSNIVAGWDSVQKPRYGNVVESSSALVRARVRLYPSILVDSRGFLQYID